MKISKEFKIGLFVVSILVVSFFLINYLRGEDLFNREIEVSAKYENVEGLVTSAPVYIKGYKAGKVSEIVYNKESDDFLVTCSIMKDFMIPEDSKMTIYGVDIMGGKGIRIDYGTSEHPVKDEGMLVSASEPALLDGMASGVASLIEKLENTLDNLNITVTSVNDMIKEGSIERTLAHLERTMEDVSKLSSVIDGKSEELESFIENLSLFTARLIPLTEKLDTTLADVSSIAGSINPDRIEELITSFRDLVVNINDPDGSIGKLLTDDSVYNSVDELLNDIDLLIRKIQENPKRFLKISVF